VGLLRLATKYRPTKFQHIVGQPDAVIVREIFRDLESIPPLVLFCGPSGVGKTTIARIIAATVNCPERTNGEPCGKCNDCIAVASDTHMSVYEIDAASYGSTSALRELVSKAYMQSIGVNTFIIDEAQSISSQGWNVLLKILEEPPPNCLFILLTSEPRKVPAKIRTRALKFNFKQIAPKLIKNHLNLLVEKTGLELTPDDINVIVNMCEGSLRDAFMMAEQCVMSEFSAEELFASRDLSLDYFMHIVKKDYVEALSTVDVWWSEIGEAQTILSQMTGTLEKVILIRNGLEFYGGASTQHKFKFLADTLDINTIALCLEQISEWFSKTAIKPQITLLTSKMYKDINGSVAKMPIVEVEQKEEAQLNIPVTASSLRSALEGF